MDPLPGAHLKGGAVMKNRMVGVGLTLVAVVALAGVARAQDDAKKVDKGKEVFAAQHCSMCHSIAGKGNPKTPLDDVGDKLKPEEIKKYITAPKEVKADSKMKAYPNLPAEDLDGLVSYLSTLKKK
jgi:mono/diheme cytochrome c family protein